MSSELQIRHEQLTIADLMNRHEKKELNLSPTFQRKSVWRDRDRHLLIESLLRGFPIPAIFLYQRNEAGRLCYDVIDGKQRLESILRFVGSLRPAFTVKAMFPGFDAPQQVNATSLKRNKSHMTLIRSHLLQYRIPVVQVNGDLSDIVELFVRINSTGKPLTPQEKRNAKYSGSDLLQAATSLANKLEPKLDALGVFNAAQKSRMKHVEFCAEIILSMHQGDVLNKKAAVDRVMAAKAMPVAQLKKSTAAAFTTISLVARMFPELASTRFKQTVDFYTLVVLVGKLQAEGAILIERHRNAMAWDLLKAFGVEVDRMREQQRKVQGAGDGQENYRDYLMTVSQMTDDISQRRHREKLLRGILGSVFASRDGQRGFSPEQRRLLWNSSADKRCTECGVKLSWGNFSVDHVDPHSRGGRSALENAALICQPCNSSKGNRLKTRRITR
ncbi:MAG: DUF262 domain-containing protein [Rhodoferax sp.]|jgi:Protein of unknown function DUF262/HNH endonuclease|nr:DUF262 domain-containing protein [Rhodoferax sp.]MBK9236035.1 DUF262 domain-containing protein [Rhodoferax sp.]